MSTFGLDPVRSTVLRILDKYLKNYIEGVDKVAFMTHMSIIADSIARGDVTVEEVQQYLRDFFDSILGDDVSDDVKNKIIEELIKAFRAVGFESTIKSGRRRII